MNWKKRDIDKNKENELIGLTKDKLIARLLSQRSVPVNEVPKFLSSSYNDLRHPHELKGTKEAAELFCKVALNKGSVCIIGDFDADGIISSTMLKELCTIFGLQCKVFLPSRITHGYGLSHKSIESIKAKFVNPPDLLFITDCGSSSEQEVIELKEWGAKHIIIIDHHIVEQSKISKSADVLINWHLCDFEDTCACGEVFHFIRAIRWITKKVNPLEFLSMAAIGILADVSPVIGDNRMIVKNGLKESSLNNVTASGLNALIRKANIKGQLSQEDVLFRIAPRINAVGRLDKPDIAHKLLIEQDPTMADLIAEELNDHNDNRKKMQREMEKEAVSIVEKDIDSYKYGIAVYNPAWSIGIVGLIASRLAEKFCKPTIVMSKNGEVIKGSGRTFANVNLKEVLDNCKDMFEGYGGHKGACGVTLKNHALNDINLAFNRACETYYSVHGKPEEIKYYDAEVKAKTVNLEIAQKIADSMYPYCNQHNPEPVFLLSNATIVESSLYEKDNWRILSFFATKDGEETSIKMKMFSDNLGTEIEGMVADIYFTFPQIINTQYPSINVLDFVVKNS